MLHVDSFYWRGRAGIGQVESTPEEWRRTHEEMIDREQWVIDGMKLGVLQARLAAADTVIFLDVSRWACLWGVLQRRLRYRGQMMRPDIGVCDRINAEFIRWIWSFRKTARLRIIELLEDPPSDIVVLRSRDQVRAFVSLLPHQQANAVTSEATTPTTGPLSDAA